MYPWVNLVNPTHLSLRTVYSLPTERGKKVNINQIKYSKWTKQGKALSPNLQLFPVKDGNFSKATTHFPLIISSIEKI